MGPQTLVDLIWNPLKASHAVVAKNGSSLLWKQWCISTGNVSVIVFLWVRCNYFFVILSPIISQNNNSVFSHSTNFVLLTSIFHFLKFKYPFSYAWTFNVPYHKFAIYITKREMNFEIMEGVQLLIQIRSSFW